MTNDPYFRREQSRAKHCALQSYLAALARKVGHFRGRITINYVDAFAGPWESKTDDLSDTSPYLAVEQLTSVREELAEMRKSLTVRAFFVTSDDDGERQLARLRARFPAATIEIARGTFEDNIDAACGFVKQGHDPYSFVFLDPTGWTGLPMRRLEPLLRATRGEVLVNFMLEHIRRFEGHPKQVEQFAAFFGRENVREAWEGLDGAQRDARMLEIYIEQLSATGAYEHCVSAPIFNVLSDRVHFHLVYATHSLHGVTTFRQCEQATLNVQLDDRSRRQQQVRVERARQGELFDGRATATSFVDDLRAQNIARATNAIERLLDDRESVSWDEIIAVALREPLVCEADVKRWLSENADRFSPAGLAPRARVPQVGKKHSVERRSRTTRPG
jgi:three-Cys-motif partner protein